MAFTESNFNNWKNNGEHFTEGVLFYKLHGSSLALISLFALGETSYSREKLRDALRAIASNQQQPNQKHDIRHVKNRTPINEKSVNDEVADTSHIRNDLIILYKQQSNLHSKMKVTTRKETRKKLAFEILDIGKKIREQQARKIYIETNGCEPPKTSLDIEDITDRAHLYKMLTTNRAYISKYQKSADIKKQKEANRRKKENKEIEKILGV